MSGRCSSPLRVSVNLNPLIHPLANEAKCRCVKACRNARFDQRSLTTGILWNRGRVT
jgi:hypothetical protein